MKYLAIFFVLFSAFGSQVFAQTARGFSFDKQNNTNAGGTVISVSAPTLNRTAPATFIVPIELVNPNSAGIVAYQFNIAYNPAVIDPFGGNFGCSTVGTISETAGLSATCNVLPDGLLRVSVSGIGTINGSGTILNLSFRTDPSAVGGNFSPLQFQDAFFFNSSGLVTNSTINGRVNLIITTAATVNLGGRILGQRGEPIVRANVILTDSFGNTQTAQTNSFGYYQFTGLASGNSYSLWAVSKGLNFNPRILNLLEDLTDADLSAQTD